MVYDWMNATEQPSYGYGGYGYAMPQALPWAQPQNTIGGMLKSGAAANYNFRGMDLGKVSSIADQIGRLSRASYDPNDPLYQQIYGDERQQGMMDLSSALMEAQRQNRMASRLGRTPLFSPERGGETAFRTMTRGYQDVQSQARDRARQIIGAGLNANKGAFDAYSALATAQDANKKKKAFGIGNIADALPLFARAFA